MRKDFRLSSTRQLRTFDRALFDFLQGEDEDGSARSVHVSGRPEGGATIRTIDCRCPQTAKALASHIASALTRHFSSRA